MINVRMEPPETMGDVSVTQLNDMDYYQSQVANLLQEALNDGVVITVSNPPNWPPAMGNYDLVVSARPRRLVHCKTCDGAGGWTESECGEGCCRVGVECDVCGGSGKVPA